MDKKVDGFDVCATEYYECQCGLEIKAPKGSTECHCQLPLPLPLSTQAVQT